jgi:hypothetical protein
MRRTSLILLLVMSPVAALGEETGAPAGPATESHEAPQWSLSTGRTVGAGANAVSGDLGWPGIEARYVHGLSSKVDVGARFAFLYGSTVGVYISPAFTFGAIIKAGLVRGEIANFGISFEPGVGFGLNNPGAFLVHFPIELQIGITPTRMVNIVFGMRMVPTLVVGFANTFNFAMPILFGPGVELFLARDLLVSVQTRFGPGVVAPAGGVHFSFATTFGVGYRF